MNDVRRFPPSFNVAFFHGAFSVIMNEEFARLLADQLLRLREDRTPFITTLCQDLLSEEGVGGEFTESTASPCYDIGRLLGKVQLLLNYPAVAEIYEAFSVLKENHELDNAVWAFCSQAASFVNGATQQPFIRRAQAV